MNRKIILMGFLIIFEIVSQNRPVILTSCNSPLLGNRLFNYCFAKIIAEKFNCDLVAEPILGFNIDCPKKPFNSSFSVQYIQDQDAKPYLNIPFKNILNNQYPMNFQIHGYFQRYEYLQPYKDLIKNSWLKLNEPIELHDNKDDVVVHVRLRDGMFELPFEYYKKSLSLIKYNKLFICTDNPDHEFIKNFDPYNPIIIRHKDIFDPNATLGDFRFIMSFNKIICSQSTFCWWAAFLSNATEIYAPRPNKGLMSWPQIQLEVTDESRYIYVECNW